MRLFKSVLFGCVASALVAGAAFAASVTPAPTQPVIVSGVITAIDLDSKLVTLNGPVSTTDPAKPVTFLVGEKTKITKNGQPAQLADLAVKDLCQATCAKTSAGLVALIVVAKTPVPPLVSVSGRIDSVNLDKSTFKLIVGDATTQVIEFLVDRGTVIRKDGKPVSLGDLKSGDLAVVGFVPPAATTPAGPIRAAVVDARTPPVPIQHVVGKLVKIGEKGVIAVLPAGAAQPLLFQVTDATKIVKMNPAPLGALLIGDTVDVAFAKPGADSTAIPKAIEIVVLPELYRGFIVSVDPVRGLVTCQQSPLGPAANITLGPAILFKVVDQTVITRNGQPAPLSALRPKDLAEVKFFRFGHSTSAVDFLINVAAAIAAQSPRP